MIAAKKEYDLEIAKITAFLLARMLGSKVTLKDIGIKAPKQSPAHVFSKLQALAKEVAK